jgi:hypothetical protein
LVDHDHPDLSVSRQCALLGLPRSTLYYRPIPLRESTLRIMASIDALYLEDPCSGSRRMVDYLAREGIPISRDRVRNLMRCMGLRAIYGDFQERCHSLAATQAAWINGSAMIGSGSSVGLLIHTSSG